MEQDVTDIVHRYRLALRDLWNNCFWADPNRRNWDAVYSFRELKLPLFNALVRDALDLPDGGLFGPAFRVRPVAPDGLPLRSLQVNQCVPSRPDQGVWEQVAGNFPQQDLAMSLLDTFDWSSLGYADLRYFVVIIERFEKHPEKVGQHALVDVNDVTILLVRNAGPVT